MPDILVGKIYRVTVLGSSVAEAERPLHVVVRAFVARAVALLCLATIVLGCVVDFLPAHTIIWLLTPTRLILVIGLIAVAATGKARFRTPLDIPVAILLASAAVANVTAGQQWASWRGLLTVVGVYYLAVGVRRVVLDAWPALVLLALVCVTIASTVAVQQVVQGIPTGFCRGAIDGSNDICGSAAMIRATGTFTNPNLLAAFLVLMLPIAAAHVMTGETSSRLLRGGLIAMGYLAVIFTGSRGGVIAAIASLVVFLFLRRMRSGKHTTVDRPLRWLIPVGVAVVVVGVLFAASTRGGKVGVRADVWVAAVKILAHHPLGVGPGRAGVHLSAAVNGPESYQHAHNLWLNYGLEDGIGGLGAVIAITVIGLWIAFNATKAGSATVPATATGMSAFVIMSLADHPANNEHIAFASVTVLAMLVVRPPEAGPAVPRRPEPWSMFDETAPIPRITDAPPTPRPGPPTPPPQRPVSPAQRPGQPTPTRTDTGPNPQRGPRWQEFRGVLDG